MRASAAFALVLAAACGGPSPAVTGTARSPSEPVALSPSSPQLAEGVVAMGPICAEGAHERCDALDDDCDGKIDEGCPGGTDGPFVAAVAWNGQADVDLVVTGPRSVEPTRIPSRGGCEQLPRPRIERIAFPGLEPGVYRVELADTDACGGPDAITASASVAVQGAVIGVFNRPLETGQRVGLLEITLAPEP